MDEIIDEVDNIDLEEAWRYSPWIDPAELSRGVYILHFKKGINHELSKKYGDSKHYVGCSENIYRRVGQHRDGTGSVITKYLLKEGVDFFVAAMFPGETYAVEAMITKLGATSFCPICRAESIQKKKRKLENNKRVMQKNRKARQKKQFENSPFRK